MPKTSQRLILGLDPGIGRLGFGALLISKARLTVVEAGCVSTSAKHSQSDRLLELARSVRRLLAKHRPSQVAVERLFFSKNRRTALRVSEARGAILAAIAAAGYPIVEFTPSEVKSAVTGYGHAAKTQVQRLVSQQLRLKNVIKSDDAADALAVAICAAFSRSLN